MNIQILEKQSYSLYQAVRDLQHQTSVNFSGKWTKGRLNFLSCRLYSRFERRQEKLFNYQPDGFASLPVQPSGAVEQVTTKFIDGHYFDCDCSECDCLYCGGCDA
jgi:hypothetical protein